MIEGKQTYKIRVKGLVQGVGFRPFIYRLAIRFNLQGTVDNRSDGVLIIINCNEDTLKKFEQSIIDEQPNAAEVTAVKSELIASQVFDDFKIVKSVDDANAKELTEIGPDIAVCDDCLADIKKQPNRILYPLTNCTHCGPRFSIIRALPYDRELTTMDVFPMCDSCKSEYENILDRRFHAQPTACNICGPVYSLHQNGKLISEISVILSKLSSIIEEGGVVAIKGLGGFHLMCDALNDQAVAKMRDLKKRDAKPFAVMFSDIESVSQYTYIEELERETLLSWKRPITLLKLKKSVGEKVTNGFSKIGAMLPYLPFHHLMFEHLKKTNAVVLTSGNWSDEPIIIDNQIMIREFEDQVDAIIEYNRDIYNRVDDSVIQKVGDGMQLIRRSRSYAPQAIKTPYDATNIVAVGAELLNTFAVGRENKAILSQHIGDLKNPETLDFYEESMERFTDMFRIKPEYIVCDKHPDYLSSKFAKQSEIKKIEIQHHHAHIASCMTENNLDEEVIGIVFDGTGLGDDGNIWGGEFFIADLLDYTRYTHFDYIPLPGGDSVTKEPWRTAVSVLYQSFGMDFLELEIPFIQKLDGDKTKLLMQIIDKKINSPLSSGMGRFFDAVAALCGLSFVTGFHAEAPMRLEDAIQEDINEYYPYDINEIISTESLIKSLIQDLIDRVDIGIIAAKFHNTIVEISIDVCKQIRKDKGLLKVVLSGGSFQNKYLSERLIAKLTKECFDVYYHQNIPSNDGGISLGQIAIASKMKAEGRLK